jgi:hypothetical protein
MSSAKEISDLRRTLNTEVDSLRDEFTDLKTALQHQLELTAGLASYQVRFMFVVTGDVEGHMNLSDANCL